MAVSIAKRRIELTFFHGRQSIDTVTRTPRATIKGYKVVLSTAEDTKLWDVVDKIGFSVADNCLATSGWKKMLWAGQ